MLGTRLDSAVLHVGCGNSQLGRLLHNAGFQHVVNVDYSEVVIAMMQQKEPSLCFICADCAEPGALGSAECYDFALDKGAIDSLFESCREAKGYLNYTRVNARILACELLKEWAYEHRHLGDRGIDVHCLCRYKEFAGHLLYFHDRWADTEHGATRSKILGQPHGIIRSKNKDLVAWDVGR
eukprot:g3297.t1